MAPKLILSHQAYLSTILHASKHPHQPVNGVLLGSTSGGSGIVVERAIPLLHHWTTLSPMMEIGLELASTHAANSGLQVVGYYQASPTALHSQGLGPVGEKILSRLCESVPEAAGILIHLDEIRSKASKDAPGIVASGSNQIELQNRGSVARTLALIGKGLQTQFYDFDDHLENVHLDWLKNEVGTDKDWRE